MMSEHPGGGGRKRRVGKKIVKATAPPEQPERESIRKQIQTLAAMLIMRLSTRDLLALVPVMLKYEINGGGWFVPDASDTFREIVMRKLEDMADDDVAEVNGFILRMKNDDARPGRRASKRR